MALRGCVGMVGVASGACAMGNGCPAVHKREMRRGWRWWLLGKQASEQASKRASKQAETALLSPPPQACLAEPMASVYTEESEAAPAAPHVIR